MLKYFACSRFAGFFELEQQFPLSFYGVINTLNPLYIFLMIFQRNASFLAPDITCSNERAIVFHSSYSNLSPKPHHYVNSSQLIACLGVMVFTSFCF